MVVMISAESLCILSSIVPHKTSSGARPALPMGVAPEAIVEKLISSIGSKTMCLLSCYENITQIKSSGARSALPMVVAPEAIAEYLWV
jgi:hypothetical protein